MFSSGKIHLFWWNEKIFHNEGKENYGDLLSKYIVEKVSNKQVVWANPNKRKLFSNKKIVFAIGSILAQVSKNCSVWGSGIISKSIHVKNAEYLAVRGPQTREYLMSFVTLMEKIP